MGDAGSNIPIRVTIRGVVKYKRYNFYAINNTLDKNDSQYGIYQFKRGFGGHVIEFIGEFILPVDKPLYKSVKILSSIKNKLKK